MATVVPNRARPNIFENAQHGGVERGGRFRSSDRHAVPHKVCCVLRFRNTRLNMVGVKANSAEVKGVVPENPSRSLASEPFALRCQTLVMVMQSANLGKLEHRALVGRLHRAPFRAVHCQGQVRAPAMVVVEVHVRMRRRWRSFKTMTRSKQSRRTLPIRRSTNGFCQGLRGAVRTCSMPMLSTRL